LTEPCIEIHELEDVLTLPEEHPRRLHLEGCPRCRALLASYLEFLDPADPAPEAERKAAKVRLDEALDREIPGAWVEAKRPSRAGLLERLRVPWGSASWRPALLVIGILLVVITGRSLFRDAEERGLPRYRGEARASEFALRSMPREDGAHLLSWRSQAGADEYRVRLFGADLLEKASWSAGGDTALVLTSEMLEGRGTPSSLTWSVSAIRHGDRMSESELATLAPRP